MLAIQLNEFAEQSRQSAILEERNRMARDIHDTLAQGFTGVIVQLESAEDAIASGRRKEVNKHLRRASELARRSLNEARRSVHALRPQALQRSNFWEALKGIVGTQRPERCFTPDSNFEEGCVICPWFGRRTFCTLDRKH